MNKQEFAAFAAAMKTFYPKEKLFENTQSMQLWFQQLEDIPSDVAEAALRKWVALERWLPTIAEIRATALEVRKGVAADWSAGWDEACRLMRKHGSYNAKAALAEMSELTKETVKRLGYVNLCRSENIAAERANFRLTYEQLAEREKTRQQLPEAVTRAIEMIQRKEIGENNACKRLHDASHSARYDDR